MKVKLWSINRWLRWTGFVMFVGVHDGVGEHEPTTIGIVFVGWPPERAWARHCERTRLAAAEPIAVEAEHESSTVAHRFSKKDGPKP